MESENSSPAEIARVAIWLPSFWAERPASWFTQAEAQFHLAGISNELMKFYRVVWQLEEKYVAESGSTNVVYNTRTTRLQPH
jgi:hypothetical protein